MYSDIPVGVNYIISWYPIVTTDKQLVNKQLELPNSASPLSKKDRNTISFGKRETNTWSRVGNADFPAKFSSFTNLYGGFKGVFPKNHHLQFRTAFPFITHRIHVWYIC
jgi:hypothetical protein